MIWFFVAGAALISFVVAAVAVGAATADAANRARPAVFDVLEAVDFVAERLPPDVTATISYEDVQQVILWHLEFLERKGVAGYGLVEGNELAVVSDDEPLAFILGRADAASMEIDDVHVAAILDAQDEYYEAIGAIGTPVDGIDEPR